MAQGRSDSGFSGAKPTVETLAPFYDLDESGIVPGKWLMRRGFGERLAAIAILVIAAPLIALLALIVRLTSAGPALFRQIRLGKGGRPFVMLKLRTMVDNAEALRPASWTRANDPRVTPVGTLLRKWHLDELPQLFNVAKGDMALVGPRPETPEIAERLRREIPLYDERYRVLPGIVGLAQINLPPDTTIESVRKKLALDIEYIRSATLSLDLRMLIWSFARLVGLPFEPTTRVLGLSRSLGSTSHAQQQESRDFEPTRARCRHNDAA